MKSGSLVASKYRLVTRLGQGGMGAVWSAVHLQTGAEFAIKFLHPLVASENDDVRQRFLQEARMSSRVRHPNIIEIFDAGETDDGTLFIVMELLDGMSLGEALRADPPLTGIELLMAVGGSALALAAAHKAGIIHRDIKPPNIHLHRNRETGMLRPKLLDFGVSKVLTGDDGIATHTGSLLGSPRYMAPEQAISAARADHRSDIWSFGVILFEAFTGEFPHEGDSSNALIVSIATKPPKSIHTAAAHLPIGLRLLIDDCLQSPGDRIQSADQFVERLREVLVSQDLSDVVTITPRRAKNRPPRPEGFAVDPASFPLRADGDLTIQETIPELDAIEPSTADIFLDGPSKERASADGERRLLEDTSTDPTFIPGLGVQRKTAGVGASIASDGGGRKPPDNSVRPAEVATRPMPAQKPILLTEPLPIPTPQPLSVPTAGLDSSPAPPVVAQSAVQNHTTVMAAVPSAPPSGDSSPKPLRIQKTTVRMAPFPDLADSVSSINVSRGVAGAPSVAPGAIPPVGIADEPAPSSRKKLIIAIGAVGGAAAIGCAALLMSGDAPKSPSDDKQPASSAQASARPTTAASGPTVTPLESSLSSSALATGTTSASASDFVASSAGTGASASNRPKTSATFMTTGIKTTRPPTKSSGDALRDLGSGIKVPKK